MLRRLHTEQPESFAFTPANRAWAEAQMTKYPEGRQASAVIPLLWRAQEQEGWLSRPAMEEVAAMLDMAYIRVLEVATFYFMFQLQPVGSVANIQVCGTTSCMICGAEDLVAVCKDKIAKRPHTLSADGKFSWEEVECLGACANAPMAQIGKDYYEDLTAERLGEIIDALGRGEVPTPGPQNGRYASEPASGLTSLGAHLDGRMEHNASVALALKMKDTVKRIDGSEEPLKTPWREPADADPDTDAARRDDLLQPDGPDGTQGGRVDGDEAAPRNVGDASDDVSEVPGEAPEAESAARPTEDPLPEGERVSPGADDTVPAGGSSTDDGPGTSAPGTRETSTAGQMAESGGTKPELLSSARDGSPDDLKQIKGVGPKLEKMLHDLGVYHFDQIAGWTDAEIAWIDDHLEGFSGRVTRDEWVKQAQILADGGETEFSQRAKY